LPFAIAAIYTLHPLTHFDGLVFIALVNSVAAAIIVATTWRDLFNFVSFRFGSKEFRPVFAYLPAAILILVVGLAAFTSRTISSAVSAPLPAWWALPVLWVPIVEEVVYRGFIGKWFRKYGGNLWGTYLSAALFAFVHMLPDWRENWFQEIGVPLGPFVLGLCCEYIYVKSRNITAAVAFHMAANASVIIFSVTDARWLEWLRIFYS
jgi:membrane protease YdiL (CAAX protease family)